MLELRDYQEDLVFNLKKQLSQGSMRALSVLPTGGGKTVIFAKIIENARKKGKVIHILVHRDRLLRQTSKTLWSLEIAHGKIAPKHRLSSDPVQICMVQTYLNKIEKNLINKPDILIVDEAHRSVSNQFRKPIELWNTITLGFTATPLRLDRRGLDEIYSSMVVGLQIYELIAKGFLKQPITFSVENNIDVSDIDIDSKTGDYNQAQLAEKIKKSKVVGDAVKHYQKICNGVPAICFCADVEHAIKTAEKFESSGIKSGVVHGGMDVLAIEGIIQQLTDGKISVVMSVDLLIEGVDVPVCSCVIMLRPTKSLTIFLQQAGRGLRINSIYPNAYILDHANNIGVHGLVEGHRDWSLKAPPRKSKRKKGELTDEKLEVPTTRKCEICYAVHDILLPTCPFCGNEHKKKGRQIIEEAGQLIEIKVKEHQELIDRLRKEEEEKRKVAEARRQLNNDEALREHAKKMGYKGGDKWADRIVRERYLKPIKERISRDFRLPRKGRNTALGTIISRHKALNGNIEAVVDFTSKKWDIDPQLIKNAIAECEKMGVFE